MRARGLQGHPRSEGVADDGGGQREVIDGGDEVVDLARAMVTTLAATDAAKVEAQRGRSALGENPSQSEGDGIVHRPAVERMRMCDHDGAGRALGDGEASVED